MPNLEQIKVIEPSIIEIKNDSTFLCPIIGGATISDVLGFFKNLERASILYPREADYYELLDSEGDKVFHSDEAEALHCQFALAESICNALTFPVDEMYEAVQLQVPNYLPKLIPSLSTMVNGRSQPSLSGNSVPHVAGWIKDCLEKRMRFTTDAAGKPKVTNDLMELSPAASEFMDLQLIVAIDVCKNKGAEFDKLYAWSMRAMSVKAEWDGKQGR